LKNFAVIVFPITFPCVNKVVDLFFLRIYLHLFDKELSRSSWLMVRCWVLLLICLIRKLPSFLGCFGRCKSGFLFSGCNIVIINCTEITFPKVCNKIYELLNMILVFIFLCFPISLSLYSEASDHGNALGSLSVLYIIDSDQILGTTGGINF